VALRLLADVREEAAYRLALVNEPRKRDVGNPTKIILTVRGNYNIYLNK
jgi:hypothetical protein